MVIISHSSLKNFSYTSVFFRATFTIYGTLKCKRTVKCSSLYRADLKSHAYAVTTGISNCRFPCRIARSMLIVQRKKADMHGNRIQCFSDSQFFNSNVPQSMQKLWPIYILHIFPNLIWPLFDSKLLNGTRGTVLMPLFKVKQHPNCINDAILQTTR